MQNKINNKWQWLRLILLLNILFPLRMALAAGGIVTDGTVGPAQTLSGTNVTIPQNLGKTFGKNLFHSFSQFNVNNGQTVTFTENTPNALENVISRVTGGSASNIDGTLRSTPGGRANLYLVNPSGIVFGKNAQINVPGAFHASTADEVRFQDGARFSASQPAGSNLTAAAPASFGFLGTSSATNGLLKVDGAQLAVGAEKKLDLVGRNISVENGAKLTAPEGEVRLEAVGQGSMTVPVNQPSETAHGTLALTKSTIDASGEGGGKVIVRGSDLKMSHNAKILAHTNGKKNGAGIDVRLIGDLIMEDGSTINARTSGSGMGGAVAVAVQGNMTVEGGSTIAANTYGMGAAGNIQVTANNLLLDGLTPSNGQTSYKVTGIASNAHSGSTGNTGNVTMDIANRLALIRGGEITSITLGSGNTGTITVKAGQLVIDRHGSMDSSGKPPIPTGIFNQAAKGSTGNGSNIDVIVRGDMTMKNGGVITTSTFGSGKSGDIAVAVQDNMTVEGGSIIAAATTGRGAAGNIQVTANNLLLDGLTASNGQTSYELTDIASDAHSGSTGNAGNVTMDIANRLTLIRGGRITSITRGSGNTGSVTVKTGQLVIDRQGGMDSSGKPIQTAIFNQAAKGSTGSGGNLDVIVRGDMTMKDGGIISAGTFGSGNSGNINVAVQGNMAVEGGSLIDVSTSGSGKGGNIQVTANNLLLDGLTPSNGQASYKATPILSDANSGSTGNAGNVTMDIANRLTLIRGGQISSTTFGKGDAGNVTVKAGQLVIDGHGGTDSSRKPPIPTAIFNQVAKGSTGAGGNIDVIVRGDMTMKDGGIGAGTFGSGKSGNISVAVQGSMAVEGYSIITAATSGSGKGGNISVAVQGSMAVEGGIISSNSFGRGDAGNITVNANQLTLGQESFISTGANNSNGGNITINGGQFVQLINSGLITNVQGQQGNSGNITINAENLVMETGLIQANTEAFGGSAGTINLHIKGLIPSGQSLFKGVIQETPWASDAFGLNVIEAVAPNGISGLVQSTAPQLDLSGVLSNLGIPQFDTRAISQDYCSLGTGSSLIRQGKGGLPPRSRDSVQY